MKIIKIANTTEMVTDLLDALKKGFEKYRENPEGYTPARSMLFSDRWAETTGQKPIEHWGGNFYSMLSIYKKYLERGKVEKATVCLQGIVDLDICDQNHEYWLNEFDKVFGTDLSSKWQFILR